MLFPHLVQVCAGFGSYTFQDLHILNDELTSGLDLSRVGTILPYRADSRIDQAFPPGRVKTCRLGVYTGYLSASNEAMGEILKSYSRFLELWKKTHKYPKKDILSSSPANSSG